MPLITDARVLVDASGWDDAAVFRLTDDRAIVATTDFFTPIVDDPYDFGRIAAANALSDLYAMGATPLFALNLVGWPRDSLPLEMLGEVLRGGAAVVREAGAAVVGGHSLDDPEPKYGLAAIGEVHPERILRVRGASPGYALVLTKPIGTGILATALKRGLVEAADVAPAVHVMTTLNAGAARAARTAGVAAVTDVTGFGLLGHLGNMLRASGAAAEIDAAAVPILPRAAELVRAGAVPGGTRRNLSALDDHVRWDADVDDVDRVLLADAQTSGGLLMAVPPAATDRLLAALEHEATPAAAVIGTVVPGEPGSMSVRRGS